MIETFALLGSKNIVEQLQASVGFIGSAIVFSLGIALGRERTYKIYRADGAEGPVAAPTVTVGSSQ